MDDERPFAVNEVVLSVRDAKPVGGGKHIIHTGNLVTIIRIDLRFSPTNGGGTHTLDFKEYVSHKYNYNDFRRLKGNNLTLGADLFVIFTKAKKFAIDSKNNILIFKNLEKANKYLDQRMRFQFAKVTSVYEVPDKSQLLIKDQLARGIQVIK